MHLDVKFSFGGKLKDLLPAARQSASLFLLISLKHVFSMSRAAKHVHHLQLDQEPLDLLDASLKIRNAVPEQSQEQCQVLLLGLGNSLPLNEGFYDRFCVPLNLR